MSKTRILFVDDESLILSGLQRVFRKQRAEWDMVCVSDVEIARTALINDHYDVIVTDVEMPNSDGLRLLEWIHQTCPDTIRIVLTGHTDEQLAKRAMKLAHQYLCKPVDSETLKEAIILACRAGHNVDDERIRNAVGGCENLPSLPTLYVEITQAAESETSNAKIIAQIISRDIGMSAKLLQLVNSSFFGIGRRVSDVEQAVALLGITRIKALILTEQIFSVFTPTKKVSGFNTDSLWSHSMSVAEVSRLISKAESQDGDRPDQAFTAGLLHDIGKLVLACKCTDDFVKVMQALQNDPRPAHQIEMDLLNVNHAEIGAYLLGLWGLPKRIVEAVEFHHQPNNIDYDGLCALSTAHVADALVCKWEHSSSSHHGMKGSAEIDMAYLDRIGLAHRVEHWREISCKTQEKTMEHVV